MFRGFSRSVIGASHVKKGIVCQDSSDYKTGNGYAVSVVADGHGSKKHFRSHIGSRAAVESAIETIEKFYEDKERFESELTENHEMIIHNIEKQIIAVWHNKIMEHFAENPVTDEEKKPFTEEEFNKIAVESYYGTTLVVAVAGENFTFGFQIGDGSLVAVFDDGETAMLMDYEESNPANITASICSRNSASMFSRFFVDNKKVIAVFVSTDGLYTSFGKDSDFLDYHTIIASQLYDIDIFETSVVKNITKRTHFGTEDDISLSCIYNSELAEEKNLVLKEKVAENRKKALK
ncbi:MAG: protein phosphatase 2C domain-containing protein [Ruminococcus sp.]|nr:protein phosphatase 2C domain-containing protein [Ruminococcus sp.]